MNKQCYAGLRDEEEKFPSGNKQLENMRFPEQNEVAISDWFGREPSSILLDIIRYGNEAHPQVLSNTASPAAV